MRTRSLNDFTSAHRKIVEDIQWESLGSDNAEVARRLRSEAADQRAKAAAERAKSRPFSDAAAGFHESVALACDEAAERFEKM